MSQSPQIQGRSLFRIMCHNGIYLGHPPNARVEKAIFARFCPFPTPQGRPCADEMTVTPAGVLVVFEAEGIEKLIPWANIYETDLEPADVEKARREAEAKEPKGEKAPSKPAPQGRIIESRLVEANEPVITNVRPKQEPPARGRPRGAA